jgi:predicted small lipoprotein YifL
MPGEDNFDFLRDHYDSFSTTTVVMIMLVVSIAACGLRPLQFNHQFEDWSSDTSLQSDSR